MSRTAEITGYFKDCVIETHPKMRFEDDILFLRRPLSAVIAGIAILFCGALPVHGIRSAPTPFQPAPPPPRYVIEAAFYKWSSNDVVKAFRDHGLEVASIESGLTSGAPVARNSKIFMLPSSGRNTGGIVSGYRSEEAMERAIKHYSKLNKNPESPAWWIFRKENIQLLISGSVPEKKAREYEEVLKNMVLK